MSVYNTSVHTIHVVAVPGSILIPANRSGDFCDSVAETEWAFQRMLGAGERLNVMSMDVRSGAVRVTIGQVDKDEARAEHLVSRFRSMIGMEFDRRTGKAWQTPEESRKAVELHNLWRIYAAPSTFEGESPERLYEAMGEAGWQDFLEREYGSGVPVSDLKPPKEPDDQDLVMA